MRPLTLLGAVCTTLMLAASLQPAAASASRLIDRNATHVSLKVDGSGHAVVSYQTASHGWRHVLAYGAINALQPDSGQPQVRFRLDYSGGWGSFHIANWWKTMPNRCRSYSGPPLPFLVVACTAPDGSFWALQSWQTPAPDLGFVPWGDNSRYELHLSHWSGPLATLSVYSDWVNTQKAHQLFGTLTYGGGPVYGFATTHYGAPTDGYGRLIYLDTFNDPQYGPGWMRENSFVAHSPSGFWCYDFYPMDPYHGGYVMPLGYSGGSRIGVGEKYRLIVEGPGVTPDIMSTISDPGVFDPSDPAKVAFEAQQNLLLDSLLGGDKLCHQH
jgi:hypothetical protein